MAALPPPQDGIAGIITALTICGATAAQRTAIVNEGFTGMADLLFMEEKEVENMMNNITRLRTNQGGTRIGAILTKKVKALVYWAKEQERQGLDLDADRFTANEMTATLGRMMVETVDDESKPELPTKFDVHKWVSWSKKLENYLWQVKGKNNTPLIYVIRKPRAADALPFATMEEQRMYQTAHQGPAFIQDNQKVFQILTQLLSATPAWTWISRFESGKSGKAAYQALRVHFDGPGEIMKRNNYATRILDNTHYRSERSFTFESYVTKLSEAYEILNDNGMPYNELQKVKGLLDGIQSDNQTVIAAKTTILMNDQMRTSFQVAVDRLSELIGSTFSLQGSPNGKRPARNISRMETGRGGRGRGGRSGRGGRGNNRGRGGNREGKLDNGVDISDMTRNFTHEEWGKLSADTIQQIREARAAAKAKKRKVAVAEAVMEKETPTRGEDEQQRDEGGNGNNFGSGAYSPRNANRGAGAGNRRPGTT
jgi:hypothetical protein